MKRKQLSRLVTYLIILVLGIALLFPILLIFGGILVIVISAAVGMMF